MIKQIRADDVLYAVRIDAEKLRKFFTTIGIDCRRVDLFVSAVIYSNVFKSMTDIYIGVSVECGVCVETIKKRMRAAIYRAEYNGLLKNICDFFGEGAYDYGFGFTTKGLIAVANEYMHLKGAINILIKEGGENGKTHNE